MRAMLGLLVIGLTSALLLCAHASAQWHVPPVASMKVQLQAYSIFPALSSQWRVNWT